MKTIPRLERTAATRLIIGSATIGLLVLAGQAAAVTLCASTAEELQDDLFAASTGGAYAGQDVEIDIVQGTYNVEEISDGPFFYSSTASKGYLSLVGGFTANCASFVKDASLTVLDGQNVGQVLNISNPNADVLVTFLTIQNGDTETDGGGLAINTFNSSGGSATVVENIFLNNHASDIGGAFSVNGTGSELDVSDNLVIGNASDFDFGAGVVNSRSGSEVFVKKNTMYKNTTMTSGHTGGLSCCGTPTNGAQIFGNIFWQNTNFGIELGSVVAFEFNDVGTIKGTTPNPDNGNVSVSPQFVDATNGNYRLAGDSALLGIFPASLGLAETDLAGDRYPLSGKGYVDIGAYEDTVFRDHGFEVP